MPAPWMEGLNPAQLQAVTFGDGPLLVIAGAGTGKTRTLACRVAHLIDRGVKPERILLLTFTRRAAQQMLHRAGLMIGENQSAKVWGGTFHAVANRMLRIYGRAVGLADDFTVMDQGDSEDLLNLIRNELGLNKTKRRFPRKQTLNAIYSRTVNAQEKLSDVLRKQFPWCVEDQDGIREVFTAYTRRKREQNVLDYDDLLLFWSLLCRAPRVGPAVAERFDHILVDEYQDTNKVQAEILLGMRPPGGQHGRNIMVVGDDAQSIYSFRAATVRNILDFPQQFAVGDKPAATVTLEQNYRSVQPILDASNAVMAPAKERYTKNLWSQRGGTQKPPLVTCLDEAEQCDLVCRAVLERLERGVALRQQAVLFRTGYHSDALEVELSKRNIPFVKWGGLKFIEAAHIKDMLAFLRVLENPYDELSWFRVLLLLEGIGPQTARRIMDQLGLRRAEAARADVGGASDAGGGEAQSAPPGSAPTTQQSPLHRLFHAPPAVPTAARDDFARLRRALADCAGVTLVQLSPLSSRERVAKPPASPGEGPATPACQPAADQEEQASELRPASAAESHGNHLPPAAQIERLRRFYDPIFENHYDNPRMRLRDLEQLEQIAAGYRSRSRFITDLTLDPPTSTSDLAGDPSLEEDYLILSTIHSAKGCEFDAVHIIHAADGNIPSDMALSDEAGLEEERRLLYVAMTRAKNVLCVCFPLRYYRSRMGPGDRHHYAQLTRFLPESIRHLFEPRGTQPKPEDQGPSLPKGAAASIDAMLKDLWA